MFNKKKIYKLLKNNNIQYDVIEHNPVFTIEDMKNERLLEKGSVLKNLFLRNAKGNQHYLVSTLEDKKIDLKILKELINSSRLSFASPERLEKFLKLKPGSVSPLGLLNNEDKSVILILDETINSDTNVGIHPNDNTATIWIKYKDLINLIKDHGNQIKFVSFN